MHTQTPPRPLVLAVSCLIILLLPLAAAAQESNAPARVTLSGQVVDHSSGQPVAFATVQIPALRAGARTDAEGRFLIRRVPIGTHAVSAHQLGYMDYEVEWEVRPEAPEMQVRLTQSPVLMEGIETTINRLERRRRAYPRSVRVYDRATLASAVGQNAMEMVRDRAALTLRPCVGNRSGTCILHRGSAIRTVVFIDEVPRWEGLQALASLHPHDLHELEVFGNGLQVRAYTVWFMEGMGRRPGVLQPIAIY